MKKIFTLLFAAGMFTMAQAQPGSRDNRQVDQRNGQQNNQQYGQGNDQRNGQQNNQQYGQGNDQRNGQQYGQNDFDKGYDKGKFIKDDDDFFGRDGRNNDRFSMERRMKERIGMINQEYDQKIQRVKRNFFMSWYEKQRQISYLENERQWEISTVYAKFNSYRFDDRNKGYGNQNQSHGHF